jgi:predicted dehydrogenase
LHFLVEKPIGLSAQGGEEILAIEQSLNSKAINAVGYMNRYRPSVLELRRRLATATPVALHGTWVCGPYARDWWIDPKRSGGPLNEQATHLVDLFRFLGGEIIEVSGMCEEPAQTGGGSAYAGAFRFESGVLGTLTYSCRAREKSIRLEAVTADKTHHLEGWDFRLEGVAPSTDPNAAFLAETEAFFTAVRTGNPASVLADLSEAVRTQRVVDALRESALSRRAVQVPLRVANRGRSL